MSGSLKMDRENRTVSLALTIVVMLVIMVLSHIITSEIFTSQLPQRMLPVNHGKGKVLLNKRSRLPIQERRPFVMKNILEKNVAPVEQWTQVMMNKIKSHEIVKRIRQESRADVGDPVKYCPPLQDCPRVPPNMEGRMKLETFKTMWDNEYEGTWSPPNCKSRHSVAIVIPYRDRKLQLSYLLRHLSKILQRQQINYRIFVVEQVGNGIFNKGILMNAGFLTALSRPSHGVMHHCFIFHDVDLISEDDRNMYTCPQKPRHLSVAVNQLSYKLPYRELAGGVFAVRTEDFMRLNGYSNLYWGWGGEDDDMGNRVISVFNSISRPPEWIARYYMMKHRRGRPIPWRVRDRLTKSWLRYEIDGLNTVLYRLVSLTEERQYTHVMVNVGSPPSYYLQQTRNLARRSRRNFSARVWKHLKNHAWLLQS